MKKLKVFSVLLVCLSLLALSLVLVSCDDGSSGGGSGGPYTVTYRLGEGSGTPPTQTPVAAGTQITLQGQGGMTHPDEKVLDVWRDHHGNDYKPGEKYPVTENIIFTAIWKDNPIDTNPFLGTWHGTWVAGGNQTVTLIFQESTYSWTLSGAFSEPGWGFGGAYTYSGNTATLYGDEPGTAEIRGNGDLILTCFYFGGNGQVICRK